MRNALQTGFTWYGILHKRLFKKISFLLILLLIPLLSLLMTLSASEGSALVRIAVACKDPSQPLYEEWLARLQDDSEIIVVTPYADPDAAQDAVAAAEVDAAWIFEDSLDERLDDYVDGKHETLVRIVAAESSTFESVSREKLYGALFRDIAFRMYEQYAVELLAPYGEPTAEQLQAAYDTVFADEAVIQFTFLNSSTTLDGAHVLTAPLRGLLAAVMVFCGLAATMYYLDDEQKGIYDSLPVQRRVLLLFANNLAALSIAAVFVTVALAISGQYTTVLHETAAMLGFIVMTAGFCSLVGTVCRSNAFMGAALPVILIACVAFAPVFFNLRTLAGPQIAVPSFYYLYAVNDLSYGWAMAVYSVVCYGAAYGLYVMTRRSEGGV